MPDPDLFIRTGGERRISNFLLWNLAYTELYFCEAYGRILASADFEAALAFFAQRERRFGLTPPPPQPGRGGQIMTPPMQIRVMTALVLAAAMLAIVLWLPPVDDRHRARRRRSCGRWEWSAFLRAPGKLSRVVYVAVIAALLVPAWRYTADP